MDSRWLDREDVAAYMRVRVDRVARLVKAGKLPKPSYHLGPRSPRWDRSKLDALFADVSVRPANNIDEMVKQHYAPQTTQPARPARRALHKGRRN